MDENGAGARGYCVADGDVDKDADAQPIQPHVAASCPNNDTVDVLTPNIYEQPVQCVPLAHGASLFHI